VTCSDDEVVEAVKFYIDTTDLIGTDYAAPFTLDWNSDWVFNGSHTFTAKAFDADMQSDTESVNWTVTNAGITIPGRQLQCPAAATWRIKDLAGPASGTGWRPRVRQRPFMRFAIPGCPTMMTTKLTCSSRPRWT